MKHINTLLILGIAVAIGGCATSNAGDTYSRDEARRVQSVQTGVVETVRPVKIEGTKTAIGAGAGTIVGGIAGSGVGGGGKTSAVASVLGAVAGGMAGAAAEEGITREDGMEIMVRLNDSGRVISVVQTGKEEFKPGDRVRVLQGGGETRVAH